MFTFCVCFWIIPWQFWEKIKREPASGEAGCFSFSERINFLQMWFCVPPNSCEVWAPVVFMSSWKLCRGGGRGCVFFIPDPLRTQCFINLLTSICTYKQCLQRNTFTCVDWLVHNYSYLERHGKLSVASHINNVSNPSHSMVHWPRVWRVI